MSIGEQGQVVGWDIAAPIRYAVNSLKPVLAKARAMMETRDAQRRLSLCVQRRSYAVRSWKSW